MPTDFLCASDSFYKAEAARFDTSAEAVAEAPGESMSLALRHTAKSKVCKQLAE